VQIIRQLLLRTALDTHDDPCIRYVLLRESAGLAAQAGDLDGGMTALGELDRAART
jgi:hypothetical protein